MPEPGSPIFLINPLTANAGQHSGDVYENVCPMVHTLIYLWGQKGYIRQG